jgi:hypothetical protein
MKMKKYLMTGIAALALCVGFTSCSHDLESLSEEEINELEAQKIVNNYNKAFKAYIGGEVAPNQTWGFGTPTGTRTRTENANANEWADPTKEYGGLLVPPAITPTQAAVVKTYFQTHPDLGYEDPHWSNYFIQQVYKGHTSVPTGCATPEAYLAANGSTYIIASDHMDHLIAVDEESTPAIHDHINNFNHGDCSENSSVLDNGGNANNGPFHTDKIMYMMNSTTKSFGYHNSDGSLYHTEYTALVGWKTIHDWAVDNYPGYDGCLNDTWNRSFMGFDFEQMVGSSVYKPILDYNHWTAEENQVEGVVYVNNFPVIGYETFEFEGKTYNYLTAETNMYAADWDEPVYGGKVNYNDRPSDDIIRDLLSKGYLPYSDTLKDWVKVGGTADGYFSDWIVTLTEAKTNNTPTPTTWSIRVMAEDLSATEASDFDFNDVVFDVTYTEGQSTATITLRAAGGTLPLKIGSTNGNGGFEVHEAFGNIPTTTMINTGWTGSNGANNVPAATQTISFSATDEASFLAAVNAIRIEVRKTLPNGQYQWFLITAEQGEPAGKFAVPTTVNWCSERSSIKGEYPLFVTWATSDDAWNFIWW